jgi:hypothetical protein
MRADQLRPYCWRAPGRPYCLRCERADGFMIKLIADSGVYGESICPQCKVKYRQVHVFKYQTWNDKAE